MPIGLVTIMAVVMVLGAPRLWLRPPVPMQTTRPDPGLGGENLDCACALTFGGHDKPEISRRSGQRGLPWLCHESQGR